MHHDEFTHPADSAAVPAPRRPLLAGISITVRRPHRHTAVVAVTGEVDISSTNRLWEVIKHRLGACTRTVVVDLSGVTFFDSAGLSVLCEAQLLAASRDVTFRVVPDPAGRVQRMMALTETACRFTCAPSGEDALLPREHSCPCGHGHLAATCDHEPTSHDVRRNSVPARLPCIRSSARGGELGRG